MSSNDVVTIVGVFSSKAKAERARRAIIEKGVPESDTTLLATGKGMSVDISEEIEQTLFSEEQLRFLSRELAERRSVLIVESDRPADEIVSLLDSYDAVHVDVAAYARQGQTHHTMHLYEEQLNISKEREEIGEVIIRKVVEDIPAQAELEALYEELDVEHVSVGEPVNERRGPWREGEVLVIPVYEEQLRVVRQLVMREQLRVRLHTVSEKHTIADTVRREHAVIEDPQKTRRVYVHHRDPEPAANNEPPASEQPDV